MTFQPVFLWLLAGALVLFSPDCKKRKRDRESVDGRIRKRARQKGISLYQRSHLKGLLMEVYRNHDRAVQTYPHLSAEYSEILDEMWLALVKETSTESREAVVKTVLNQWPGPIEPTESNIQKKLREVGSLTKKWDEAKLQRAVATIALPPDS